MSSGSDRARAAASWATLIVGVALAVAAIPAGEEPVATRSDYAILSLGGVSYDSRIQRWAHLGVLAAVAVAFLVGPRLRALRGDLWRAAIPALVVVTALATPERPFVGVAALCGLAAWVWRDRLDARPALPLAVAGILAIWTLPALLVPADLSDPIDSFFRDVHFGAIFDPGHRAALGARLYTDVSCQYGTGVAAVVALRDRLLGPATVGGDLALTRISQLVAVGLVALAARGSWWGILAGMAAFPTVSNADAAPNVSGLRYAGMLAGVLVLRRLRDADPRVAPAIAGFVAVLAPIYNLETGLAVAAGSVAWIVARRGLGDLPGLTADAAKAALGGGLALALATGVCEALLGVPAVPGLVALRTYGGGFCGRQLYPSPLVLAAAGHAVAVLVHRALSRGPATPGAAGRAAVAATLLAWLAYFVNRPHPSSELGYLALWALLVGDQWRAIRGASTGTRGMTRAIALLVLAPAIGAQLQSVLLWPVVAIHGAVAGPRPGAREMSGVYLDGGFADMLERQAGALRPADRTWLTAAPYHLARITGRYPDVAPINPFGLPSRPMAELVADLAARPEVLVQDVAEPSLDPGMAPFFAELPAKLAPDRVQVGERPGFVVLGPP